jgi:hypothetical protein
VVKKDKRAIMEAQPIKKYGKTKERKRNKKLKIRKKRIKDLIKMIKIKWKFMN